MPNREISESNLAFVEDLYFQWKESPESVSAEWREYFESLDPGVFSRPGPGVAAPPAEAPALSRGTIRGVERLIEAYRSRGHFGARTNPLGEPPTGFAHPELDLVSHGITESLLDVPIQGSGVHGLETATVREIHQALVDTYCGAIGVEYAHIEDPEICEWLEREMETTRNRRDLSDGEVRRIHDRLVRAEVFERYVHTKYVGAKRFSLEGAEGLIPLVDLLTEFACTEGVEQMFIGMAHRGRLNILTNILDKEPAEIFLEFEDAEPGNHRGSGDVKYHKGYRSWHETLSGQRLIVALSFNPSHLEFICPVVCGRVYALQKRSGDLDHTRILPLLIHGDASVVGQGIVSETLNLAEVQGYRTGGTIHIVINNQVGFTTSPAESRSSRYCTGVARQLDIPIFHVHGDDMPAIAHLASLAARFREKFKKDVFIDLVCFRKYGHNEGDDPTYTDPEMYARVAEHPGARKVFVQAMVQQGRLGPEEDDQVEKTYRQSLDDALERARSGQVEPVEAKGAPIWQHYKGGLDEDVPDVETRIPKRRAEDLVRAIARVPNSFTAHRGINRLMEQRLEAARGERPLDWGLGESLAYASLLVEGVHVRIDGQDSQRGTFAHRHAVFHDQNNGQKYVPLEHLAPGQGRFQVVNSTLSEAAVLGFDYGYSREYPDGLIVWEAQFGDFANGAQVIIDQFLSAAEDKWGILTGLVLLLPHGFEGQGPEHSSARLERFLHLGAEDNLQVCYPSTPGQIFHLLRRQVLRPFRKPLIVMTPKSLLRHKACVSPLDAVTEGRFHRVIPNPGGPPQATRRLLMCTGKIYYDLEAERAERNLDDVAILRMEQLYPLPREELSEALAPYPLDVDLVWVQEEPWNMGAWYYLRARLPRVLQGRALHCLSRVESASPATGSRASHVEEQRELVERALVGELPEPELRRCPLVHAEDVSCPSS